jgi:hypothetical protein
MGCYPAFYQTCRTHRAGNENPSSPEPAALALQVTISLSIVLAMVKTHPMNKQLGATPFRAAFAGIIRRVAFVGQMLRVV